MWFNQATPIGEVYDATANPPETPAWPTTSALAEDVRSSRLAAAPTTCSDDTPGPRRPRHGGNRPGDTPKRRHRAALEAPRSGRPPQVTDAVEAYLRKVVVQSPREFGYARPGWTTALLAKLIRRKYKRDVSEECVRQHLAAAGVVCRRPTWTVKYRAEEQPGYAQKKAGLPGS